MRIDSGCPEVRCASFGRTDGVETVARRVADACRCSACYELSRKIREGGRRYLDTILRPNGAEKDEATK